MIIRNELMHPLTSAVSVILFLMIPFSARVSRGDSLTFASPFTDHMVIQRGKPIQIWGSATPSSKVAVSLANEQSQAATGNDGMWHVTLKPLTAGGPFILTASADSESATVSDVLIGDVWLCSGQSNMQYSLQECTDADAVAAVSHPNLRLGKVGQAWTKTPQTAAKIRWSNASPTEAKAFSAVAYTFAHELESDPAMANIPIGILEDCLGGTVVESWLPKQALSSFNPKELQSSMFGIGPTLLYNAMIAPLGESEFTGVIWYQGEGNAGEPQRYVKLLPLLFQTWREQFRDPNLPFLIVQLPDYAPDWGGVYWQWIRESQANAVAATPNTALAVTINTNDGWNLHPQGKHEIGRRLALLARQQVYKEKVVGSGPKFKSAKVDGSKLVASFDTDGDGLSSGTGPVDGFMIAGDDGAYHLAQAVIDGDAVVLHAADVAAPATVRYAWAGVPRCTLTNRSGLPAAPFRTDSLPVSKGLGEPQPQPCGFTFKNADFQVDISGEGKVTSLVTHYQQFLSNASGNWGGTSLENRMLQQVKLVGPQTIVCSNNEASFAINLKPKSMTWTIKNTHPKDAAKFDIALATSVEVSGDPSTDVTLNRKGVTMHVTGVDRIIQYHDVSADDGKVLEVDVPKGGTKVLNIEIR
jgi:sialate O-acetylesterase